MVLHISCASLDREMNKISPPAEPDSQPRAAGLPGPGAVAARVEAEPTPDPRLITRFASSGG